jgi:hypothetical protein
MDRRTLLLGGAAVLGGAMIIQTIPFPAIAPDSDAVDGAWSWFSEPRAISIAGSPVIGAVTSAGRIGVYSGTSFTDLRGSLFQVDDHANPTLLRRSSDNKIIAFAAAHNGAAVYTYLSTNADDVSAFGAETSIDASLGLAEYSYPNPVQLTDETNDPIYLFFRAVSGGTKHYYYSTSTDQSATWAAATQLLVNNGDNANFPPYVKLVQNGNDRIDFFCTDGHPQYTATNSIYHFYYEGGNFKDTGGSNLTLPIDPATDLTPLYDGTTTRAWIWDCAIDGSGNPVCVYATFPSLVDHRYRYAKWDGAAWDDNEVCSAGGPLYSGQPYYSGGIAIDPRNVNRVIASRSIGGAHTLFRYVTADGGAAWDETQITEEPEVAIRPVFVRGQVSEPRLAYVTGSYTSYTVYDTEILLTDSSKSPSVVTGFRVPAGDMNSGSDRRIPAGDMNSGSDKRLHQEISF